jgi:hypothetical protein
MDLASQCALSLAQSLNMARLSSWEIDTIAFVLFS